MTILIIDTSTERGIVALGTLDGKIVAEKKLPSGYQNSDHIFPALRDLGVVVEQLKGIICATGPGSYTGIRVGAVVAKTLSFAQGIPLVGVCTLEGFPEPALIDAKTGGAYVLKEKKWVRTPLDEALNIVGEGKVYTPSATQLKVKAPANEWVECYPSSEVLLALGLKKMADSSSKGDLEIHY